VETRYLASRVAGVLGVSHATLNNWAHAGYLNMLDVAETTPGVARHFTSFDVFRLMLMKELIDRGRSPEAAAKTVSLASLLAENFPHGLTEYLVVFDPMYHLSDTDGILLCASAELEVFFQDLFDPRVVHQNFMNSAIVIGLHALAAKVKIAESFMRTAA
jgi:hypothetical protein